MKKLIYIIVSFYLIVSCTTIKDAGKVLRNEKVRTTDEFLVKKREPLVLPPNYEQMPIPGNNQDKKNETDDGIKNILKAPKKLRNAGPSSSIEESILNKIR